MAARFDPIKGTLYDPGQSKVGQLIIRAKEQLAGTLRSDLVYFIDGAIDMGTQNIEVPAGGLTLEGHGYDISKLYSTADNYTMFTTPAGSYAGNLTINRNTIYTSGTSSMIFDVDNDDNFGALELNTVNLGDFSATTTSLGEISGYRQFRTSNFAAIKYTQGLTLSGAVNGIALNDSIILAPVAASTFLIEGTALLIADGMSSNMNALALTGTMEWCDFDAGNFPAPSRMSLTNFRTAATDAIPNIDSKSSVALFQGCTGVDNTFIGASWVISTEAATTILGINTLYKLAGTTTADLDAWFSTDATNNRLKYEGNKTIKVDVVGFVQLGSAGTESFEVEARQRDVSASTWVNLRSVPIETALKILGDRRGGAGVVATAVLEQGDYIELWVKNVSNLNPPTGLLQSTISVGERQS